MAGQELLMILPALGLHMRAAVVVVQTAVLESPLRFSVELEEVVTERFLILPQQQGKQTPGAGAVAVD
jgi:hypothetical protein